MPVAMTSRMRFWPLAMASIVGVDGVALVVARLLAAAVVVVVLQDDRLLLSGVSPFQARYFAHSVAG